MQSDRVRKNRASEFALVSAGFARTGTLAPVRAVRFKTEVRAARLLRVTRSEQAAITDFVINGRATTWEALRDLIHPCRSERADAVIANAIALGRIRVDPKARIHDGTIVSPIDPSAGRMSD